MAEISSVLIANRGEIAVRIAKTLTRLGVRVWGLCSELDEGAAHLAVVDEVLDLSGATLADSYLNINQIVRLCREKGIDAVHPGYGFLSENPDFAEACRKAGVIFIGPTPEAITAMGSKALAKDLMIRHKVPTIPGYQGANQAVEKLIAEAVKTGFPVLLKASAGGGGKGMRIVHAESELQSAIAAAKSEGQKAFGDDRLIIEKYLVNPRHIEIQIFGDAQGHVIHLGERECSIQRRHQKIIEESPSIAVSEDLRREMGETAVKAGRALGYQNAGTVEFILDASGKFYFLEVNTRLQVEHPITEMVTGLDLVEWQLRVAEGAPLPLKQEEITRRGHALECRVYAEDAEHGFLPSTGPLLYYREPSAPFLRVDSGVGEGAQIGIHFDPMIAKVIVWGADRPQAISKMIWALQNYPILGVKTNTAFLLAILAHPAFQAGQTNTHFITDHLKDWQDQPEPAWVEAFARLLQEKITTVATPPGAAAAQARPDAWQKAAGFRVGNS
jgi:acetyl-CoA carboxylase biotin carboxylase subunit